MTGENKAAAADSSEPEQQEESPASATKSATESGDEPAENSGKNSKTKRPRDTLRLRVFAAVLGVLGALLSLSVPFLPVHHDITSLKWPTAEGTKPVSAPLVSFSPLWMKAELPCAALHSLDARKAEPATVLSTNPPASKYGNLTGMMLQVNNGQLNMLVQGQQLGSAAIPAGDCTFALSSDGGKTTMTVDGRPVPGFQLTGDRRAQLTGIFSELDDSIDNTEGLSFEARVDTRYESYGTALKFVVMILAVACFIGCVVVLRRLDTLAGRRPPRLAPPGWWKPTLRDIAVFASLGAWWLIGAMTSDDGYILTIARAREEAGYISNYYRWFAVPEAPFGWFYELYSLWVQVSTLTPWVRLPALLMGLLSWLLISREVLPRLGQQVRRSQAAGWAAAAVFLAFWLPYNNGLRPEPVVVLFSLLGMCAVERAVATRRLMPAALGLVGAALAVGANPHGIIAVTPYIAALKPLLQIVRERARSFGWLPVIAPIAACGLVILNAVFWDQTWQSVMEATELRTDLGPSEDWYQELNRYVLLFNPTTDGSLVRRFPVLLVILCVITCFVMLLRRGRIRGAALGPSRRLLAVTGMCFLCLAMTPTKWTHHFGVFAAVGGALAALTALATSSTVLRSKRNRSAFFAGLMVICAFAATAPNAWWYVSGWGVPWFDKAPSYHGRNASTLLLIVALIAIIVAFVEHLRIDEHRPEVIDEKQRALEQRSRALRLGTAPLAIICALLIVGELATFGKALHEQRGTYSLGADNVRQAMGSSCGMSDYVYVEANPQSGMLRVSDNQPGQAVPDTKIPKRNQDVDKETANDYLRAKLQGFSRPGLPPGDGSDPSEPDWKPPHQFGTDRAPVWGSYDQAGTGTGELRTQWYDLPERATSGDVPVVLSLAGAEAGANSLFLEYGRDTERGFEIMSRQPVHPYGVAPHWREARTNATEGAQKMRIVATDQGLGLNGWLAVSAPRAPQLTNMTDFIGDDPTFLEWTAALVHPCLQIPGIRNGIAEVPKFRIVAGSEVRGIGQGWSSPDKGGPFGWMNVMSSMRELPTYLKNDLQRDWGSLYAVDPYEPGALPPEAAMDVHQETHSGLWSPGPLTKTVQLPGDVPSSDDRNDVPSLEEAAEEVEEAR